MKKEPKFCKDCGEEGLLELCWSDLKNGSKKEWYTCLNCGQDYDLINGILYRI